MDLILIILNVVCFGFYLTKINKLNRLYDNPEGFTYSIKRFLVSKFLLLISIGMSVFLCSHKFMMLIYIIELLTLFFWF